MAPQKESRSRPGAFFDATPGAPAARIRFLEKEAKAAPADTLITDLMKHA